MTTDNMSFVVAPATELDEGERLVTELQGREIAVFLIDGEYYAYLNWCAHQSGPCCEGMLSGTFLPSNGASTEPPELEVEWTKEGQILNCPWHGWEYDVTTGECLSRPGIVLPSYPVEVRDGNIVVIF